MASQTHTFHFSMTITGNTKDPNDDDALWKINYNADRTTDVVVNEHFCRWEVHTEKPSVAPSSSPSFLPSLRPSDSPSLAVSDICLIFQLKTKARIPNHIFLTLAGILFSVFVFIFTALDASLIITELSAIVNLTTQPATLWYSIKQSKYSISVQVLALTDRVESSKIIELISTYLRFNLD